MKESTMVGRTEGGGRWWNSMHRILKICQKSVKLQDVYRLPIHHACIRYMLPYIFRKIAWLQPVQLPLHCRRWITKTTTSELLNTWNSNLFKHLFMHVLSSQQHELLTCGPHSSVCPAWTNRVHTCTQTHLNSGDSQWQWSCIAGQCIIFWDQKGGSSFEHPPAFWQV